MQSFTLTRLGQPDLRYAVWAPGDVKVKAAVLITTGYAEHVGRWQHVAQRWVSAGFAVAVYDLRGQGHSEGRRGHVTRFSEFVDDLLAITSQLTAEHGWDKLSPPILFGHSLGGLISTITALDHPQRMSALALASPYFCLAMSPPGWKLWTGRRLSPWLPTFAQPSGVSASDLTHDRERARQMDNDPLRVTTVTARWFTEVEAAQARIVAEFPALAMPVYCRAAGDDRVSDVSVTRRLFEGNPTPTRRLEIAADRYHELHQESDWCEQMDAFARQFDSWCSQGTS